MVTQFITKIKEGKIYISLALLVADIQVLYLISHFSLSGRKSISKVKLIEFV